MYKGLVVALLLCSSCFAKDKRPVPEYQTGVMLAFADKPYEQFIGGQTAQSSLLLTHHDYNVTIAVGDMAYTASMGRHYGAKDLIIGDPVQASVDDKYLYFKLADGTPTRGTIVQRARYKQEKK